MNFQERELFWKTLCSLPGQDVKLESEKLRQTIKYPKYLFRYRPVSIKSLEALRCNKLYFKEKYSRRLKVTADASLDRNELRICDKNIAIY